MSVISSAKAVGRAVEVKFEDGKTITFEDCWLRDHCRWECEMEEAIAQQLVYGLNGYIVKLCDENVHLDL